MLLDCPHNKQQALLENIAGLIGGFISSSQSGLYADFEKVEPAHQQVLRQLVQELSNGIDGVPRIKKQYVENVKELRNKFGDLEAFNAFVRFGLEAEGGEEAKTDSEKTEKKLKAIMDLFAVKQAKAAPKKDFRAFLKQQKNVGAQIKSEDVIVVQEKLEEQQMND